MMKAVVFLYNFLFLIENWIFVHGFYLCLDAAINNEMTINHIVAGWAGAPPFDCLRVNETEESRTRIH